MKPQKLGGGIPACSGGNESTRVSSQLKKRAIMVNSGRTPAPTLCAARVLLPSTRAQIVMFFLVLGAQWEMRP